ncbi:MAG: biotin/lipoyl-binding protein [Propionicimonas sp.]
MMFSNSRVRAAVAAGTALVVVAGIGIGVANSSSAASARYVTATVGTGDVVQTYTATGSITRKNTQAAAFTVDGTVKTVAVAVGDTVAAGDVLATLKKGPLQLAVLNAETAVAQAQASLYSAQHPASASSSGGSGGSSGSSGSSGSGGSGGGSGSGSGTTVTIDPTVLNEAVSRINLAVLAEAQKCGPVFGSILPAAEPTATTTPASKASATPTSTATATAPTSPAVTATSSPTARPTASPTATASATPTATAAETTTAAVVTPAAEATSAAAPEPTSSASQLDAVEANDPTKAELQACANARGEVLAANTNLQTVVTLLTTPKPASPTTTVKKPSSSSSSSASVSARAVASAKADLLKAQQDRQAANGNLDAATLVAPISGTVGLVGLATGDSASGGTITIVGSGSAIVTFELPLVTRGLVTVGQEVTVTPAGSTTGMTGKLTAISSLETSGTSGTPTYTTTVAVSDADQRLATGARASVAIAVKSAIGVIRVPASAVTPTGAGTATVKVLANAGSDTTSSVDVKTGAVGGGWVAITAGLEAGKLVVLADTTAAIPTNVNGRRTTTTTAATSRASAGATASAASVPTSGAGTPASAQPTGTATK